MADQPDLADDLLRGAKEIALVIYGKDDKASCRRLYHEQARWPVFKLDDSEFGVLYALRSRIKALLLTRSAEKEADIAAAAAKARVATAAAAAKARTAAAQSKRRRPARRAETP